jgi:hypothetical protein
MDPTTIERVHVIFKTHLDIGFTDMARAVTARYMDDFIPQALSVAEELRKRAGAERFVWTTGAWLIWEYLERAAPAERQRMERAIAAGDIAWHALPFTTHSELIDADLFAFGISMARELDARFRRHTIAAKMTDVPGHTRAIVPILAAAGVKLLHIGVNAASHPPDVPDAFVWRDPSGAELLVMYQRGGYGDLSTVAGLPDALAFAHTGDNQGPQSADDIVQQFEALRARFPGALVRASTLDAFAEQLLAAAPRLPVVTAEIGDTWIHGIGSDPAKVSRLRELSRLRRAWLERGEVAPDDERMHAFSRPLLLVAEHTWGLDEKTHLADYRHYTRAQLREARHSLPAFQQFESSWAEQRGYLDTALAALEGTPFGAAARANIAALTPVRPDTGALTPFAPGQHELVTPYGRVAWDAHTVTLDLASAGPAMRIVMQPLYQTFAESDYERFRQEYNVNHAATAIWAVDDYTKPGIGAAGARSAWWQPERVEAFQPLSEQGAAVLLLVSMPSEASEQWGCPALFTIEIAAAEHGVQATLQWFDKAAIRLPEAIWFKLQIEGASSEGWSLRKMGQWIDPLHVVRHGNRHLHAVEALRYTGATGALQIEALDAPLVAPGEPALLRFPDMLPDPARGVHFNLYNNVWGTNFRMWYDEDARFRFVLHAQDGSSTTQD